MVSDRGIRDRVKRAVRWDSGPPKGSPKILDLVEALLDLDLSFGGGRR